MSNRLNIIIVKFNFLPKNNALTVILNVFLILTDEKIFLLYYFHAHVGTCLPSNQQLCSVKFSFRSMMPTNGDGKLTHNDNEKAELLNKFFTSVFTQEDTSKIPKLDTIHT